MNGERGPPSPWVALRVPRSLLASDPPKVLRSPAGPSILPRPPRERAPQARRLSRARRLARARRLGCGHPGVVPSALTQQQRRRRRLRRLRGPAHGCRERYVAVVANPVDNRAPTLRRTRRRGRQLGGAATTTAGHPTDRPTCFGVGSGTPPVAGCPAGWVLASAGVHMGKTADLAPSWVM